MATPTAAEVRDWSQVDFNGLGYTLDADLQRLVDLAVATLARWTGQSWSGSTYSGLEPATGTEAMAKDAVQVLTERAAYQKQEDRAEAFGDFDLLTSLSAAGYSESRRNGKDSRESFLAAMANLLWPLMTYAKQDEWREMMGQIVPAFETTEMDWHTSNWDNAMAWGWNDPWQTQG